MSDRLPGSNWSNPILYRDYRIYADDCAGTHPMGWAFVHEDYDPTPLYADDGPSDHRHGWARTIEAAKAEIDCQIEDLEDADRSAVLKPFQAISDIFAKARGDQS
jgi:hypothetical protein